MAIEFKFPDVGEGIHEGQLVKWLVKEGDKVNEDQSLAEVETDKAIVEIPSPSSGTILRLHVKEGSIIKVGEVIVTIGEKGEKLPGKDIDDKKPIEKSDEKRIDEIKIEKAKDVGVLATLRIRKLAEEKKADLKLIHGTGIGGSITEEDILNFINKQPAIEPKQQKIAYSKFGEIIEIPMSNIRKRISEKMSMSKHNAAHVTHIDEADVTDLVEVRNKKKKASSSKDAHLTFLPYIVKAVIISLKNHKYLNSSLDDEDSRIIIKKYYHIGIAMDTKDGLIVPNIKNADKKGILDLAKEINFLSDRALARKLGMEELQGGSFTVSNIGSFGGLYFTPVINYPEVAILGIGRIIEKPIVIDGKIEVRKMMPLSLSYDHRVVDGAESARFMNDLIKILEDPDLLSADQE